MLFIPITGILSFIILFIISMNWCGRDRVPVYQQWNVLFSCSDPLICGLGCWEISVLGSLLNGGGFRACHLIGWRHDHQPVGGPVAEPGLACMDFDTGFLSNLGPVSLMIFLPAVRVRWKLRLAVIPLLAIRSQQVFAHATTAQLSCHVRNFVAITVFEPRWERSEVSIEFELRWGNR